MKSKWKIVNLTFLLGGFFTISIFAQNCKYDKNGFKDVPWGHILTKDEIGKVRQLRGKIFDPNQFVINRAWIALYRIEPKEKVFVGSQLSGAKGNFCFKNLPSGKYEMRVAAGGFNSRYFIIELIPNDKKLKSRIEAFLEVGQ